MRDATLYFNRSDGFLGYNGSIIGAGMVQIYQGTHGFNVGTGGNTSFTGFGGTVNLISGAVYLRSANGLGSGTVSIGNGAYCDLATSATTTFANPITLNGIGGTADGYAEAGDLRRRRRGRLHAYRARSRWRPPATSATTETTAC